tara:strand:- start:2900 stop:3064 length:165 start_codon:yes stop_codon:yes gene_type:complete
MTSETVATIEGASGVGVATPIAIDVQPLRISVSENTMAADFSKRMLLVGIRRDK